jgi:Spy/CpxP family protein refolding chaperone
MKAIIVGFLALVWWTGPAVAQHQHNDGYAAMAARSIKALSDEQVSQLSDGRGMGLSLSAELNSYPGPLHALEMADALHLTPDQQARLLSIKEDMRVRAIALGQRIIAGEAELDRTFALGTADRAEVVRQLAVIGQLNGELRAVHILAHMETRALLTAEQVARYDIGRGYRPAQDQSLPGGHRRRH